MQKACRCHMSNWDSEHNSVNNKLKLHSRLQSWWKRRGRQGSGWEDPLRRRLAAGSWMLELGLSCGVTGEDKV